MRNNLFALMLLALTTPALAQGPSGYGGDSRYSGSNDSETRDRAFNKSKKKHKKDSQYARGQSILAQKVDNYRSLSVCVDVGSEIMDLSQTTSTDLSSFGSREVFGAALHDCSRGGQPALSSFMDGEDVSALVHFLDTRLELQLAQ